MPFKLLPLDISDETSIQSFRIGVIDQTDRLDALINNAGYLVTGLAEETSVALENSSLKQTSGEPSDSQPSCYQISEHRSKGESSQSVQCGVDGSAECRGPLRFEACSGGIF